MKRTLAALSTVALCFALTAPVAHAARTCFGEKVTIGGTRRSEPVRGTPGNDVIDAGAGDDLVLGRGGNDLVCGGAGDDVLEGGKGADHLGGGPGTDLASFARTFDRDDAEDRDFRGVRASLAAGKATGDGTDRLVELEGFIGSTLTDVLVGNGRANLITGLIGSDRLRGGGGVDAVSYELETDPVTVDLGAGFAATGSGSDTLRAIESVIGSAYDDELLGDDGPNVLEGLDGVDTIDGRGGDDLLHTVGYVPIIGGPGDDVITGRAVSYEHAPVGVSVDLTQLIATGEGRDRLLGVVEVYGSPHGDTIIGGDDADVLDGGDGADTLDGRGGVDELWGRAGDDALVGGAGNDLLYGYDGNDTLDGGEDGDSLYGERGDDRLSGGPGNDELRGDDPSVYVGPFESGDDDIDGGEGIDSLNYHHGTGPIDVDLVADTSTGQGTDTVEGVENVWGTIYDDRLSGDDGPNIFYSGSGADRFYGLGGDDILHAVGAGSEIDGGEGRDECHGVATETNCEV